MADLLAEQRDRFFRLQEALEEAYPGLYHRTVSLVEVCDESLSFRTLNN
jgi:hypothetical protein